MAQKIEVEALCQTVPYIFLYFFFLIIRGQRWASDTTFGVISSLGRGHCPSVTYNTYNQLNALYKDTK